jgi:hypothetical protein
MHAQASPAGLADPAETGVRFLASLPDLVSNLVRDTLDLVALEGRAAAIRIALLVSFCVFAACFALFAWFGLCAMGFLVLLNAGLSQLVSLAILAALNAALAGASMMVVYRVTHSALFGEHGERRIARMEEDRRHA